MSKNSISDMESQKSRDDVPEYVPLWSFSSTRLYIALILMFVVLCALNMRTNIGMAMVCMVNSTAYTTKNFQNESFSTLNSSNSVCQKVTNPDHVKDLGYHGCIFPAVASLIAKWFPATERGTVAAIYTSGNQIGASLGTYIAAKLCLLTFLGGWPMIFYMYGILGIICTILWYLFATNKPEECTFIDEKEKNYLVYHLSRMSTASGHGRKRRLNVPWKNLLTSLPVWSCMLARFAFAWTSIVMTMLLPSYLRDVLYLDMSNKRLKKCIEAEGDHFKNK
uniref:Inorganic phosphate cotransporter n=1 Tax=Acrobeloides nanus TaxID=290746 RepID=A0A914E0C6_9BILA